MIVGRAYPDQTLFLLEKSFSSAGWKGLVFRY